MKKMFLMMACILMTGLAFQSCNSNDQKIQNEVQKVIMNDYRTVSTSVKDGVVTLTGTADSQTTRMAAETVARSVKGVKSVVNNITVNSTNQNSGMYSDSVLQSTIANALTAGGYNNVKVAVNNGEVTLTGDLSRSDLTRVMQIANEANPRKVNNNITLK